MDGSGEFWKLERLFAALGSRCSDPCLGRSDAPSCSFRSKCQVKALLHGRNGRRKDNENLHDMQGKWTKETHS